MLPPNWTSYSSEWPPWKPLNNNSNPHHTLLHLLLHLWTSPIPHHIFCEWSWKFHDLMERTPLARFSRLLNFLSTMPHQTTSVSLLPPSIWRTLPWRGSNWWPGMAKSLHGQDSFRPLRLVLPRPTMMIPSEPSSSFLSAEQLVSIFLSSRHSPIALLGCPHHFSWVASSRVYPLTSAMKCKRCNHLH